MFGFTITINDQMATKKRLTDQITISDFKFGFGKECFACSNSEWLISKLETFLMLKVFSHL